MRARVLLSILALPLAIACKAAGPASRWTGRHGLWREAPPHRHHRRRRCAGERRADGRPEGVGGGDHRGRLPGAKPFFSGLPPAHDWLARAKPDVAVVVYNDHGLSFFLDKMPTFAIRAAPEYRNADEGWGIPTLPPFRGDPDLSCHIIESVVAEEFDPVTCQEMLVDHGFSLPMKLFWPGREPWPVRVVPVSVNTVQHPLPTPARCLKFGQAIGRAIASYPEDLRVVVLGTGGLSLQLDGTRAGFILL